LSPGRRSAKTMQAWLCRATESSEQVQPTRLPANESRLAGLPAWLTSSSPIAWTLICLAGANPVGDTEQQMRLIKGEQHRSVASAGGSDAKAPAPARRAIYVATERAADVVFVCCLTNDLLPSLLKLPRRPRSVATYIDVTIGRISSG